MYYISIGPTVVNPLRLNLHIFRIDCRHTPLRRWDKVDYTIYGFPIFWYVWILPWCFSFYKLLVWQLWYFLSIAYHPHPYINLGSREVLTAHTPYWWSHCDRIWPTYVNSRILHWVAFLGVPLIPKAPRLALHRGSGGDVLTMRLYGASFVMTRLLAFVAIFLLLSGKYTIFSCFPEVPL